MMMDEDDFYGDDSGHDDAFILNASAPYAMLEECHPINPLEFEQATIGNAERVDAKVLNPFTGVSLEVENIIYERLPDGSPPVRAYWVGRKLTDCIYGCVRVCTIIRFRNDLKVPWEITEERAVVKVLSWQMIQELRHAEDPIKEVAALQYMGRAGKHPNIMCALDVLQDDEYLLVFMPYCSSGSLYDFVSRAGVFPERVAIFWFRQILEVRVILWCEVLISISPF
jgi:serine/threonine protein kinase